jgi:hypothetical protein
MYHNETFLDFGVNVRVIFTGVKSGKSTFLEANTTGHDEYYGSSYVDFSNWKVIEQDSVVIDDLSICICHHLKTTATCFKKSNKVSPLLILAATNLSCWEASFEFVESYPPKFYTTAEWISMIKKNTVDYDDCDLKADTEEMARWLQRQHMSDGTDYMILSESEELSESED